jgi:hypothetical protein
MYRKKGRRTANRRQHTADNRQNTLVIQQRADSRKADSRQQVTDRRQETGDSKQSKLRRQGTSVEKCAGQPAGIVGMGAGMFVSHLCEFESGKVEDRLSGSNITPMREASEKKQRLLASERVLTSQRRAGHGWSFF